MSDIDLLLDIAPEQGSDGWLNDRIGRFTASRFSDLMASGRGSDAMGATAYGYILEVVTERLTGLACETFGGNAATDWGSRNEPEAKLWLLESEGLVIHDAPFVALDGWTGGSPDGYILKDGKKDVLVEIKCPHNSKHHTSRLLSGEVPKEYIDQIQGNLWITGLQKALYIDFDPRFPNEQKALKIEVPRDEERIAKISQRVQMAIEEAKRMISKLVK